MYVTFVLFKYFGLLSVLCCYILNYFIMLDIFSPLFMPTIHSMRLLVYIRKCPSVSPYDICYRRYINKYLFMYS